MPRWIVASAHVLRWSLVVAAVLLAPASTTALAAPTLTASPTTVKLASCRDMGKSTLTWSGVTPTVPGVTQTDLYVNTMLVEPAVPPSDSFTLTVTGNNTYKVDLRQTVVATGQMVVATVTVTSTCSTVPRPACPGDCFIGAPTVTPHGTFATFNVTTSAATSINIAVGTQADANGDPLSSSIKGTASGNNSANIAKSHDVFGLQAKTLYFYVVQATDANGATFTSHGSFTTLARTAEIHFEKIFIINDSDGDSEGDLEFTFLVEGQPQKSIEAEADTGESVVFLGGKVPLALFVVNDAPATLKLAVVGCDDDSPDFPPHNKPYCPLGGISSSSSADWATTEQAFDVPTGPVEETWASFAMTTDTGALKFTAHGKFRATYK